MIDQIKVIRIKTNAQNMFGWIALTPSDQPVGHIFMHVEPDKKIKFMDAWVHEEYRRQGIFRMLWDARWKYVTKNYAGHKAYAWCMPSSLPLLLEKGFTEGETCVYVEKDIPKDLEK